jgi:SPP1 gp7 family putative phage head morphogenesis protein
LWMNKQQKQVLQSQLNNEKVVLHNLQNKYKSALDDINKEIAALKSRTDAGEQYVVYQVQYQEALKKQISGILDMLNGQQFNTISDYLQTSYEDGFVGVMYDLHGQGIPLVFPIDQKQVVKAVQLDTKLSKPLYNSLGENINNLKHQITDSITRGIASNASYSDMAKQITRHMVGDYSGMKGGALGKAMQIARTESHRITNEATFDAQLKAKDSGADIVKQWDAALDKRTRPHHAQLDGQIREIDKPFEVAGHTALYPGGFGIASEDINCRCAVLQRAKWDLDDEELQTLKDRAKYFGLDKNDSFEEFKEKYLVANKQLSIFHDNPYVIENGSLPPARYQFPHTDSGYADYIEARNKWKETHTGSVYDYYVEDSAWITNNLSEEQIERIKRFDATVAKLQKEYPLYAPDSERLYVGSYDRMGDFLNDMQQSRMDPGAAQAQFWFNPDTNNAIIGFEPIGTSGTLVDDLMLREKKIANGEILSSVLDKSPEGIAIHEWGHGYTKYITQEMIYSNPSAREYWEWYKSLDKDDIAKGISSYATTNRSEFEAECFAELLTGEPRPIAQQFGKYLDQCKKDSLKRLALNGEEVLKSGTANDFALALKKDTSSIKTVILPKDEYAHVMSEIATNLTEAQKNQSIVSKAIGNHVYTFENNGFGNYRIISKKPIDQDALEWWDN